MASTPPPAGPRTPHLVGMNFKVEVEFRKRFRLEAARCDLSLKELLEQCWQAYCHQTPGAPAAGQQ